MHRQRMSILPEVPGMSSREKSGVVVARFPTTTKLRIGWWMGVLVDLLFVLDCFLKAIILYINNGGTPWN